MKPIIHSVLLLMAVLAWPVSAQEQIVFSSELNQTRYQALVTELRCPKCQNQNVADSESSIALDLRRLVFEMIEQGKTDQEIIDYMVARYGAFVLYRPEHSSATFLLWYGPFILLAVGVLAFVLIIVSNRKRRRTPQ
ncbi:cytochrome c-type biogenesis protein CcmH [Marinomonas sp. A79]|uniref:Cytochrome c-type biogenesis protein n=1 Tax=Marinomonas vulgaris TaxID=2823372 RepID=A0ABS5HC93_9GAMM|nr:cytochrome c-type biogenesis protein [Marinomonas vulgaris]MBR7888659.1 cytochrome c-type biogenesis protein CcmH [Marinomonas vulgaris]